MRNRQVCLRLVLVQKRTRLEFSRRTVGHLYTCGKPNIGKENGHKYKEYASRLSEQLYIKGDGHQEVTEWSVSIRESAVRESGMSHPWYRKHKRGEKS